MRKKSYFVHIMSFLVISLSVFYLFWQPFKIVRVSGDSMSPSLHNSQLLFMTKKEIKRNDIVTFIPNKEWELDKNIKLIKRVVGVPGDKIQIKDSKLYINGLLHTDFSHIMPTTRELDLELVTDTYFIMGDNVGHSLDSLSRFTMWEDDYTIRKENIKYAIGGIPYGQ